MKEKLLTSSEISVKLMELLTKGLDKFRKFRDCKWIKVDDLVSWIENNEEKLETVEADKPYNSPETRWRISSKDLFFELGIEHKRK